MSESRLSTEARPAGALYGSYFGLTEAPFSIAPDPRYLFMSERHREALAHLLYGVGDGGGFVQLTGEVGTGKTTLGRALLEQLPPTVDVALILNPRLTALELLATVCDELRIPYPRETTSLKELVDALYRYLLEAHARGRRTVLIIDEAQGLTADVLEQVRLLTNLETEREKLLQIILIGQPELLALLERPELRQLAQRVTARYHLQPFSQRETREYIRHRLRIAGRDETAVGGGGVFTDAAVREVHRAAGGVARLINVICDRALLGAYAHDRRRVNGRAARRAAREVLGRGPRARGRPGLWAAGLALVGALAGIWLVVVPERLPRLPGWVEWRGRGGTPALEVSVAARDTPPPAPSALALGGAPPPPTPTLADVLADPSLRSDQPSALRRLHAQWQPDARGLEVEGDCSHGRVGELRCLARAGTWTRLRRFDVPAVIELSTPSGDRHYAAVTQLGEERATLELDDRALTFSLSEIEPYWDGAFVILWRPPADLAVRTLPPGARGKDVAWLRERLAALGMSTPAARDPEFYDATLMGQVIAFQRGRLLAPDGIVGEETLAHLALAAREPGTPSLSASRP